MKNFLPSIDNVSGTVERVHQLAMVPVYGHRRLNEADDHKTTPIAILQLINKANMKAIEKYDLDKIEAMRDLIGRAIDNASEHHSVINARVGISEDLNSLLPKFEYEG